MGGRGGVPFVAMRAFLEEYGVTHPDEREMFYEVMAHLCGLEAQEAADEMAPAADPASLGKMMDG